MQTCNPLAGFGKNVTSQHGEDGILEEIFKILDIDRGWCVEFGACEGKRFSNTHSLVVDKGWSGIFMEPDKHWYPQLKERFKKREDVYCFQCFVDFEGETSLDALFSKTPIPDDFDLISIDINGNDIHVWASMKNYHPKVVVIEYNPTIPNSVCFEQARDMSVFQGSSLAAFIKTGKELGYELIATTVTNAFFVRKDLYPKFEIEDNSINALRPTSPLETRLYQLYDGTLVLDGFQSLAWEGTRIRKSRIQIYPRLLRATASDGPMKRIARKLWRWIYRYRPI